MSNDFNVRSRGSWTRANVTVGLENGLDLRESVRLCVDNNIETRIHRGDGLNVPLHNGIFNLRKNSRLSPVPYSINRGDAVEVVVRGTVGQYREYVEQLCAYLSSRGLKKDTKIPIVRGNYSLARVLL